MIEGQEDPPVCFWTGKMLRVGEEMAATSQFSTGRITFDAAGKALPYGHEDQLLLAASRFANCDLYALFKCILIEKSLNFAKGSDPVFQDSESFEGHCQMTYGVQILRGWIKELLQSGRRGWREQIYEYPKNPFP
ncbi:hypothetical protein BGZ70_002002 [Mortierella alpina]|uniref:Uncharacterized protein n=1 Tax=Mortierella alpina TaxID=64518 RepID=A0A9P6JBA3_MORAP|nr:hypothetical protein BGZ70_002002 [Mortierella alpina]